jgi:hypothetical protein
LTGAGHGQADVHRLAPGERAGAGDLYRQCRHPLHLLFADDGAGGETPGPLGDDTHAKAVVLRLAQRLDHAVLDANDLFSMLNETHVGVGRAARLCCV